MMACLLSDLIQQAQRQGQPPTPETLFHLLVWLGKAGFIQRTDAGWHFSEVERDTSRLN